MNKFSLTGIAMVVALGSGQVLADPPANLASNNSSLLFIALDNVGTAQSLVIDLGFSFSDFRPGSNFYQPNQSIAWNFANNTVSVNGVAKPGTYNWSTQFSNFQSSTGRVAAETGFGVIGGSNFDPVLQSANYLTTGTPTALQLASQLSGATSNLGVVDSLYGSSQQATSSFGAAGFGANYATGNADGTGSLAGAGNFGPGGDWAGNLAWSAFQAEGQATNFFLLNGDANGATQLAGAFNYANGQLTFTSPIPEPSAMMMSLAGLAVLYGVGRRRRQGR